MKHLAEMHEKRCLRIALIQWVDAKTLKPGVRVSHGDWYFDGRYMLNCVIQNASFVKSFIQIPQKIFPTNI